MSIRFFSSGNLNYKAQAWTNKYYHWRFIHARTSNWQKDFGCSKQHSKFVNSKYDKKKKWTFLAKFNQILKITLLLISYSACEFKLLRWKYILYMCKLFNETSEQSYMYLVPDTRTLKIVNQGGLLIYNNSHHIKFFVMKFIHNIMRWTN